MMIEIPDIEDIPYIVAYETTKIKHHTTSRFVTRLVNISIPRKAGIYFLYDKINRLLYIGQTADLLQRISNHRKSINPYYIKYFICEKSKSYRLGIEHILIDKYQPFLQLFSKERERG